jgi:hypothetical protein
MSGMAGGGSTGTEDTEKKTMARFVRSNLFSVSSVAP